MLPRDADNAFQRGDSDEVRAAFRAAAESGERGVGLNEVCRGSLSRKSVANSTRVWPLSRARSETDCA